MRSAYGEFESQGKRADGAAWAVANVHHIHATPRNGYACLCGATPVKARWATEHIIDELMQALKRAGIDLDPDLHGDGSER